MYVKFFHLTSPFYLVQLDSFLVNPSLANCSNLYCRLVIRDVILVDTTALMEIGEEGGEKRSRVVRFESFIIELYPLFKIWPPGQRICGVCFVRTMRNCQVVFLKDLLPSCLMAREILRFMEELEVLMIH